MQQLLRNVALYKKGRLESRPFYLNSPFRISFSLFIEKRVAAFHKFLVGNLLLLLAVQKSRTNSAELTQLKAKLANGTADVLTRQRCELLPKQIENLKADREFAPR